MERAGEPHPGAPRFTNLFPASTSHQSPSTNHYHTPYSQLQHPQFASPPIFPPSPSRSAFGREKPHRLEDSHLGDAPHDLRLSDVWWRTVIPFLVLVSNATFSAVGEFIKSTISITVICLLAAFGPSISMLLAVANLPLRLLRDVHHNLQSLPTVSLSSLKGRWYHKTRTFRPIPPGALNWRSSPTHTAATTTAQQDLRPTRRTRGARLARDQTPPPEIPAAVPLVKIDLKARLALGAKRNFQALFQWYKSEVEDPEYDALVESAINSADDRAPPQMEMHRLRWEGEAKDLANALDTASKCLITDLMLVDCEMSVQDLHMLLDLCPALEVLEVRQLSNCPSILPKLHDTMRSMRHRLRSLTLRSEVPLDLIFTSVQFTQLQQLSLNLFDAANAIKPGQLFRYIGPSLRSLRIRGDLTSGTISEIEKRCLQSRVALDIGHVCRSVRAKSTPHRRYNA
ncbi:hypothetical protein FA15DRAFT_220411 [Coprinopsis marcescibilis]|uniref:RNI-like protein n=1 Tax=Coprinopsis marcescibilis TaxID=230819 RepID=A0A5C3L2U0_COPMA|nr:hypothetical protein FA15DRAFT_220411 [Coprinopsis marcescibilis]